MATESYGRTDDGIAWVVHHRLGGQWWWTMKLPDGQVLQSTYLFDTEQQALEAVEDARLQAVAVRAASETMASLRARAEAAEALSAQAEAAGYRRAIDDACAAIEAEHRQALEEHRKQSDHEWRSENYGRLSALREVECVVRALAPVEPVSPADELPAKGGV